MKIFKLILTFIGILIIVSFKNPSEKAKNITVQINFGKNKDSKKHEVSWQEGLTALEALQYSATIETHPVGKYVFVTSIDNTKGQRGVTAWYYKINGESPKKLAINQEVSPGDTILWIYTKDVCSGTVDGCSKK